jgi:hypothetical protein
MRTPSAALAALVLLAGAVACSSSAPSTGSAPKAAATHAAPKPVATRAASTPAPAKTRAAAASPAQSTCAPVGDILVRYVSPDLPASASRLGGVDPAKCRSTFKYVEATSPTGAGYCTEAAWAKDNPGYNVDAERAAPLKNVQVKVGPAC